ncbi:MAG: calcium-binding protein [Pseudomonadota bacterium]
MIDAKSEKVRYISTEESPFAGLYLPYHLAAAAQGEAVFVKTKMTRSILTWELVDGDVRILMKEDRRSGEIARIVVFTDGAVTLRLKDGAPMQASELREEVETLDRFATWPFIDVFDRVAQAAIGRDDEEDHVRGGRRDDRVFTGGEDDTYVAGRGDDDVDLGEGEDTADYSELNRGLDVDLRKGAVDKGRRGTDAVEGVENLVGTDRRDEIRGDGQANALWGGGADDVQRGRGGDDELFGGDGDDVLFGGGGRDRLHGGEGDDRLKGGGGEADVLFGGDGDDHLQAGRGADVLDGGAGADVFAAGRPGQGVATIQDFNAAEGDRLQLPGSAFDYVVLVQGSTTEIRRDGVVVATLAGGVGASVLEDALFV